MEIKNYLDSTYLKTAFEANLSEIKNLKNVYNCILEAHKYAIYAVMIRPEQVEFAKNLLNYLQSEVKIGTVISFPKGNDSIIEKLSQAKEAIQNGADDLDFVINYSEFKNKNFELVKEEFILGSRLCIENNKTVKWIIETAALTNEEISSICELLSKTAQENFNKNELQNIFLKSSTGYFESSPNGATLESIELMLKFGNPLPIKASGGIRSFEDAEKFINLGVKRIGTSNAVSILTNQKFENNY